MSLRFPPVGQGTQIGSPRPLIAANDSWKQVNLFACHDDSCRLPTCLAHCRDVVACRGVGGAAGAGAGGGARAVARLIARGVLTGDDPAAGVCDG